jgi:hypothetical protein
MLAESFCFMWWMFNVVNFSLVVRSSDSKVIGSVGQQSVLQDSWFKSNVQVEIHIIQGDSEVPVHP